MRSYHDSHEKSFTLIELIVSIVLITVVSVVCLEFCAQYLKMAFKVSSTTIAVDYAQGGMESIYMNGGWGSGNYTNASTGVSYNWSFVPSTNAGVNDYEVFKASSGS